MIRIVLSTNRVGIKEIDASRSYTDSPKKGPST